MQGMVKKRIALVCAVLALGVVLVLRVFVPAPAPAAEVSAPPTAAPTPQEETPEIAEPEETAAPEPEKPKTLAILGDSYSAFKGWTDPGTNVTYYPISDPDTEGHYNNVEHAEEMWWYLFAEERDYTIVQNDSYSGSPVCYDGPRSGSKDARDYSYVQRCMNLQSADLIIIEGGTNDSTLGVRTGEYKYGGWEEADFESFRSACAFVVSTLRTANPDATVVFMLNNGLRADVSESVITICEHYAVPVLRLSGIEKQNNHPDVEGMVQIKDQLCEFLDTLCPAE